MRGAEIGSGSNTASAVHVLPQTTENSKRTAGTSLFFCSLNRRWPRISAKNRISAAENLPENSKSGGSGALSAHEAFDLVGSPGDCLVDGFALLRAAGDHLGHRRLRIHLRGDVGRGRRAGDRGNEILPRRVIVEGALGRPLIGPGPEIVQLSKRRQVVTLTGGHQLLHLRALRQKRQQALGSGLVGREVPNAPEIGQERVV